MGNLPRLKLAISAIDVGERIRKDFGDVQDLAESIASVGLIQPIVLDHNNRLIAGERRLRAHVFLKRETIDVVYMQSLDEGHKTILEATENIQRKAFDWKEVVLAIDKVHSLKTTENALIGESWGVRETGRLLNTAKSSIQRAVVLAQYIRSNDPEILKAEGPTDAFRVLIKRAEDTAAKALVASTIPQAKPSASAKPVPPAEVSDDAFFASIGTTGFIPGVSAPVLGDDQERPGGPVGVPAKTTIPLSSMLHHRDVRDYLRSVPAETFDAVITDWPYGNDPEMMSNMKDFTDVEVEHQVDYCKTLHRDVVPEIFRILKPNGWFITWTDFDLFEYDKQLCLAAGFKFQRWPLVWHKTSACGNQAANQNFTKNYEIAIACRKGTQTLIRPQPSSIFTAGNDAESKALGHPFAKPFSLWEWLYNATLVRGSHILEPFAGSGSAVIPALRMGMKVTAVESNEKHFNTLNVNLQNFYRSVYPDCDFS